MATDPERGLLVNANHLTTHNGSYVTVQPGQQCACGCCEEWYIFTRDDAHFQHWEQTTDDLSTLCNNTNLLCYDDLYPKHVAICANSFAPRHPGTVTEYLYENEFDVINGPDVRFYDNFVYPEEGPDNRGLCGFRNFRRGDQHPGSWQGPVFYHVPWYFQVNFAGTRWPLYNGWPRAVYSGTLTESTVKTTQQIAEHNNSPIYAKAQIEFVYRELSTGQHNCQDANCSNFYIYKKEYDVSQGGGATLEMESHWGCRPLLCTGDFTEYDEDPTNPAASYLYNLNASHVPCGHGCTTAQTVNNPFGDDHVWYEPHELSCKMGNFGGVRPSVFSNYNYNESTGQVTAGPLDEGNPIDYAFVGTGLPFLGRITTSHVHPSDGLGAGGVCSYKIISDTITYQLPGLWDTPVPDYSDPDFLDPGSPSGINAVQHYFGYLDPYFANSCGCRSTNCVKESNPVSEGVYTMEPVPFRPYGGLRMFVDLEPQAGINDQPFSIYLDYLSDKREAESFTSNMSGRIVFDSAGSQYLVSNPYAVDLSTDGKPNYPERSKGIPTLSQDEMVNIATEEMAQISVEFGLLCRNDTQSPLCSARLNVMLHPSEGITSTLKQVELNDEYFYTTSAVLREGHIEIHVQIPYGASSRVISRTIRPTCFEAQGCTFETISDEPLNGMSIDISAVVYQQ